MNSEDDNQVQINIEYNAINNEDVTNEIKIELNFSKEWRKKIFLRMLPVTLRGPKTEIKTFALL